MTQIISTAGLLYDPRLTDPVHRLWLVAAKMELALNKTGAITVTLPDTHPCYGQLTQMVTEVWVIQDGVEIFRARVREINEDLDGLQEIVCEGLKGCLRDELLRPYVPGDYGSTVRGWLTMAINTYNTQRSGLDVIPFELGTVDTQALDIEGNDYKDILSSIDSDLIKAVGGYVTVERVNEKNVISWTKESGPVGDQVIEYGLNLTGYKRDDSAADMFTAVVPLGKSDGDNGKLTIKSVNGGSDMLMDSTAVARSGLIVKKVDFNDIENATELKAAGQAELDAAGTQSTNIEVDAVDLADAGVDVSRLRLGYRHRVRVVRHGTDVLLPISRISVDLMSPGSGKYTLSEEFETLTQQQRSTAAAANQAANIAANAATPESVAVQIAQSEAKYSDYVTGLVTAGGWTRRTWNSGRVELIGSVTVTPGTPSVYTIDLETATAVITLPVSVNNANITANVTNGSAMIGTVAQTAATSVTVELIAPTIGAAYDISLKIEGGTT